MNEQLKERVVSPISDAELERRWKAVREVMRDKNIDFVIVQSSNDYMGGFIKWFTDLPAVHFYPASLIFPVDDDGTMVSHGSYDPELPGPAPWLVRGVKKRLSTPSLPALNFSGKWDGELVVEELKNYKNVRIAFLNEDFMNAGFVNTIRKHLSSAEFVDITDEIDLIKAIKSPEEIERIKASAFIHDEAMKAIIEAAKPGMREYELNAIGRHRCRMLGSEQQFILMGSAPAGQAATYNHIHAMNRVIQEGDTIGVLVEAADPAGYYTHLHRSICVGEIPEVLQQQFEIALEAQKMNLDMVKPGIDPLDMLEATNTFAREHGFPEETRIYAHGQGYDLVERPSFQPGETMKLAAGMNIAIHPGAINAKAAGQICDNYIVTENGVSECLHKTPKKIFQV